MKLPKLLSAFIIVLLLFICAANAGFASKADTLIDKAERAVAKAEAADTSVDRNENYKQALDIYSDVIKNYGNSVAEAKAMYGTAYIKQTAKGEHRNERAAYDTYKALINKYGKPDSELTRYEKPEIAEIREIVAKAQKNKDDVAAQIDKENSSKTLYKVMDFFVNLTGGIKGFSYWFAIILVTVIVKLLMTPLTKAQFKAMKEMQKIAPLVKEIQEKYKGDQKTIGEKTMDLYKEHGVNPFASCLPILVQMPILWLLYYMIRQYEFKFAEATFLWIGSSLSHITSVTVPFMAKDQVWITAKSLAEPDLILVLLYVVSMYISTKLSAVDPSTADQQKMMSIVMPIMFAFIFAGFPSAFLLYWLVFNVIQTVQQYMILNSGRGPGAEGGPSPAVIQPGPTPPARPDKPAEGSSGETRPRSRRRRRR